MIIHFLDLKAQYLSIKNEVDEVIEEVLLSSAFTSGPFVKSFEDHFADAHHARYCVAVNSGTAALHAALCMLNIRAGDEVIMPVNTFFATPESVSLCGGTPVFVDCDASDYNMDIKGFEKVVTKKTKAIIPVHLYGQPARMSEVLSVAEKYQLPVIEDCAQAHLASIQDRYVGTFGICGCFSFYPGKNLGAYGEGGAILTNNEAIYQKLLMFRDHGMSRKYHHEIIGHNYRMNGIQGAILDVKLRYLEKWTEIRRNNAKYYRQYLEDCQDVILPEESSGRNHVYHLYVIRVKQRDALMTYLKEKDIDTGLHYPVPCHLQRAYQFLGYRQGSFPLAEQYAQEILSLPMSEQLTEEQIQYVCEHIKGFYKK